MEEEFLLDGGNTGKVPSNPKLSATEKIGVIGVSVPNLDPEKAKVIAATNFDEALKKLAVDVPLNILGINTESLEIDYKIRQQADLTEKGMVAQIPVQRELFEKQQALHKLHEQLTNNYRTQRTVEELLANPAKKDAFVQFLRMMANKLSPQN